MGSAALRDREIIKLEKKSEKEASGGMRATIRKYEHFQS